MNKYILLITILFLSLSVVLTPVFANSIGELEEEFEQKQEELENSEETLENLKQEIVNIQNSDLSLDEKLEAIDETLAEVNRLVDLWQSAIDLISEDIAAEQAKLDEMQAEISQMSGLLYKQSRGGLLTYIFSFEGDSVLKSLLFKRYIVSGYYSDLQLIQQEYAELNQKRIDLEDEQEQLDGEKKSLEDSKNEVLAEKTKLQQQLYANSSYASQLEGKITLLEDDISELQAAILIAKSGGTSISINDVPATGDLNATLSGFMSNAPSGYFATFSFGAYTHRNGMSQYGAQARAENGQSVNDILSAYYGKVPEARDTSGNISTTAGSMDFETTYMYGIAEMPSSWNVEALKAQAIAARTYAYGYRAAGNTICVTESCQVWLQSKSDNPPAAWKAAVDATAGKVLIGVNTQYSATSGGYLNTSGWDTTDGNGGQSGWASNAWESIAASPWFYKSWYRYGYSDSASSCGRYAWMSEEEMSDILNTWLVLKGIDLKGSVNSSRILPVTINECQFGTGGGNPYSMSEMRGLLNTPVTSISGHPVVLQNNGSTTEVVFSTNRGSITIPGSEYKEAFNSRAPGYLAVPQSGFSFIDVKRK
jgi:hypothetical protein